MTFLRSHYFWRTYLGYITVAILGTVVFSAWQAGRVNYAADTALEAQLQQGVELLSLGMARQLATLNYEEIRAVSSRMAESSGLRLTVIDQNGIVVADSHENPFAMDNHLRRPEIQTALVNGQGRAERYSYTLEESFRYLARVLVADDRHLGFVRVAKSTRDLGREIQREQLVILRNASVVTFLILLLAFYLAARQASKVAELTQVAEVIASGRYNRRVTEGNALGLRRLSEAINQMARSAAQRVTEITSDRNRLTTIFTCMVEGVIDVDMEQKILHINEAAARLLEVDQSACIGKVIWQEIRSQEIINALDEAIKTHSVIKTQMRLSQEAVQLVIDIYAASLSDDNGTPIGAVLVLHDITDLKNLERVRTDFVANASHELKTPITAIRGLSETIMGDTEVDQQTLMHFMDRIHAQSLRLSQLVGDLMTISRLESTQSKEEFVSINLSELVNQAVNTARGAADEKGHKLVVTLPERKLEVYGDRQNLSQLVDNLIDNAIKYTSDPGEIRITLDADKGQAVLKVQDSGIGISPQYQQRVFERFYRVDKARSQSLGGTGLGLSIVKNIAEKHGGQVMVESQLGRGSTFTFRIPLAP